MKELLVRVISKKRDGHEAAVIASGLKLVRCPRSLAVTRHGFTFYVADPSAPFTSREDTAVGFVHCKPLMIEAIDFSRADN